MSVCYPKFNSFSSSRGNSFKTVSLFLDLELVTRLFSSKQRNWFLSIWKSKYHSECLVVPSKQDNLVHWTLFQFSGGVIQEKSLRFQVILAIKKRAFGSTKVELTQINLSDIQTEIILAIHQVYMRLFFSNFQDREDGRKVPSNGYQVNQRCRNISHKQSSLTSLHSLLWDSFFSWSKKPP